MAETHYVYCDSKCKHPAFTEKDAEQAISGRIATFTKSVGVNASTAIISSYDYPEGFTYQNSIVISAMVGSEGLNGTFKYSRLDTLEKEPLTVTLEKNHIQVEVYNEKSSYRNMAYKIAIMRYY